MGRKKKVEKVELTPSKYQQAIIEFIKHDVGNLVVEAAAGCGKTSTLVMAIKEIPTDKNILFCAFNKDIVKDIKKKTKEFENVTITTVHGLGLKMLSNNYKDERLIPNENKYRSHLINNIKSYSSLNTYSIGKKNYHRYLSNIMTLLNLTRLNLYQSEKEIEELVYSHGVEIIGDEIDVVLKLMEWGKTSLDEIDYTDMIWLPHVLYCKPYGLQFDFVFGDEAQDFSTAQRELLLKCKKINTRFVFVGDENQAIYAFASADKESFIKLKNLPNTTVLPLPISYRCARQIVKFAQNYVPTIEANENDERVGEIKYDVDIDEVCDGDMILCRNNAPLMQVYTHLIQSGKKCYIRGKDIGKNLKNIVKESGADVLNQDLKRDGVFVRLYANLFDLRDYIIKTQRIDSNSAENSPIFNAMLDKIKALEILSFGLSTSKELIEKIDSIFSDKDGDGISLSTIHKAKGLEAENVYIACKSLMPSKSAMLDWEKQQEKNLIYVAYTRAKNTLGFLKEDGVFKDLMSYSSDSLKHIERLVNDVLGRVKLGIELSPKEQHDLMVKKNTTITLPKKGVSVKLDKEATMLTRMRRVGLGGVVQRKLIKR